MAAKTVTEKQLIKLIDSIIPCVIERKDEFEIPSLKGIEGRLRRRVHTKTQDTKGKKRKYRSKLYAKKHKKKGAVNMRLTGNLSRDYGVYIDSNGDYSLGFLNKPQTVRTKKLGRYKKSGKRFKKKR